jgi:hypothetical protein
MNVLNDSYMMYIVCECMSCDHVKINKRSEFIFEGIIGVSMSKSSKFENIEYCYAQFLL